VRTGFIVQETEGGATVNLAVKPQALFAAGDAEFLLAADTDGDGTVSEVEVASRRDAFNAQALKLLQSDDPARPVTCL